MKKGYVQSVEVTYLQASRVKMKTCTRCSGSGLGPDRGCTWCLGVGKLSEKREREMQESELPDEPTSCLWRRSKVKLFWQASPTMVVIDGRKKPI